MLQKLKVENTYHVADRPYVGSDGVNEAGMLHTGDWGIEESPWTQLIRPTTPTANVSHGVIKGGGLGQLRAGQGRVQSSSLSKRDAGFQPKLEANSYLVEVTMGPRETVRRNWQHKP